MSNYNPDDRSSAVLVPDVIASMVPEWMRAGYSCHADFAADHCEECGHCDGTGFVGGDECEACEASGFAG